MEWGIVLVWAVFVGAWIWALIDCIRVPDDRDFRSGTKVIWVIVIVLLGFIGAIIYLLAGRPDGSTRSALGSGTSPSDPPGPPSVPPGALPPPPAG